MNTLRDVWQKIQGEFLFAYTYLVARTVRWKIEGKASLTQAKSNNRPLLWCFWHGQLTPFFAYGNRFEGGHSFALLIVGDERHNILNVLANKFGAITFKADMQGNPVASGRAVLRVIQAMKSGQQSLIAPDGPDGPPFVAKPGVALIARKASAAVLPVGLWTRYAYQLRRWDRYLVPFPFARIHMAIGKPIIAKPKTDGETLLAQITEALNCVRFQAQKSAGIKPWP